MEVRSGEVYLKPDSSSITGAALPGIQVRPGFSFRSGQLIFLQKLAEAFGRGSYNHLGVFVPGYGKTITALASFLVARAMGTAQKLVVFVPRGNLRDQYADPVELERLFQNLGAPPLSFCVADSERVFLKNLSTDIIITTYQYASGAGGHRALLAYCQSGPCMFVFDEVHHLSEDGLWALRIDGFPHTCSVALSGTPMRSDNKTLFGVPFEVGLDGEQYYVALHEVTMRQAHEEGGILKRVKAHVIDYRLRLVNDDSGEEVVMSLSAMMELAKSKQEVDTYLARRKLRFHDVYLETLLKPAFNRFAEKRAGRRRRDARRGPQRNHQMLIIAMSNRHAEAVLEFVQSRFPHFSAARIGQDVPAGERLQLLDDYREGRIDVMVQVDMIGEGTDIKPISIIVKADLVRALSKTMQQVFRGMRYYAPFGEDDNVCDIFAPNDTRVVSTLEWIGAEEQAGIKLRTKRTNREGGGPTGTDANSPWVLKEVRNGDMRTHTLDLFGVVHQGRVMQQEVAVVDVGRQEKDLRKACAELAVDLAHILRADGNEVPIKSIHQRAKEYFSKSQGELSLRELEAKKTWLERCIRSRKMT